MGGGAGGVRGRLILCVRVRVRVRVCVCVCVCVQSSACPGYISEHLTKKLIKFIKFIKILLVC